VLFYTSIIFLNPVLHHSASCFLACEWQGHKKPLHPVSVELDEKGTLQLFDRSGSPHRRLNLGNQDFLDIHLSNDQHQKALMLKVSKEYDLVSSWTWGWG